MVLIAVAYEPERVYIKWYMGWSKIFLGRKTYQNHQGTHEHLPAEIYHLPISSRFRTVRHPLSINSLPHISNGRPASTCLPSFRWTFPVADFFGVDWQKDAYRDLLVG